MYIFDGPVNFCFSFFVAFCNDEFPTFLFYTVPDHSESGPWASQLADWSLHGSAYQNEMAVATYS